MGRGVDVITRALGKDVAFIIYRLLHRDRLQAVNREYELLFYLGTDDKIFWRETTNVAFNWRDDDDLHIFRWKNPYPAAKLPSRYWGALLTK